MARMILACLAMLAAPACATTAPPLRPAVEAHLRAIATRNLDDLLPTITSGTDLQMIAPDGYRFTTRQQYVDFHRGWFSTEDGGRLDAEVVHVTAGADLGHALVRYRYGSKVPNGTAHEITSWLALTFALEDGRWRLVCDQNTLITNPAATRAPSRGQKASPSSGP